MCLSHVTQTLFVTQKLFFAIPVVGFKNRTVLVFFYFSSKKVTVLRWKEAPDKVVSKRCEV